VSVIAWGTPTLFGGASVTEQLDLSEHQSPAADPRKSRPQSRWASLAIIGAAGCLLSLGGARAVIELDREALRVDFERRTGNFMAFLQTDVVQNYTQSNQEKLTNLHRIMKADGLTEERLAEYAAETENSDFVRSSFVFLPRVPAESVAAFEADVRERSKRDFTVREHDWDGGIGDPAYRGRVHYPIVDFRTEQTDIDLRGYNLASNRAEETALELALSRNYPLSIGYTTEEGMLTFIHLLPVKDDFKHPFVEDGTCEGFVGVLTDTSLGGLSEFFPLAMSGLDTYLISSPGRRRRADDTSTPAALIRASVADAGDLAGGASIDMGGRHWDVVSTPRTELTNEHATNTPTKVACLILLLTLAMMVIVARAQSRARRVEDLIARRTAELSAANQDLAREVAERKKNRNRTGAEPGNVRIAEFKRQ
jgi:CHASE1-domain containing sensor protein